MKTVADKLRNSIQYGLGVMDSGSGEFKELSNKIDELFELSYLEGQSSPKVKQLEWDFYGPYYSTETPVGHYMILHGDEQYLENYTTCTLTYNGNLIAVFSSIDEAQSAAQAAFEKRIMECLDIADNSNK